MYSDITQRITIIAAVIIFMDGRMSDREMWVVMKGERMEEEGISWDHCQES